MLTREVGLFEFGEVDQLKKFDETLICLRRQFRKLLKHAKLHKNCKHTLNTSEEDSSGISKKTNDSNERLQDVTESTPERKNDVKDVNDVDNDISIIEVDKETNKLSTNLNTPEILEEYIPEEEIAEMFDSIVEESLYKQLEQSKLNAINKKNELQKSPVLCRSRVKAKKTQSPKVNLISWKDLPVNKKEEPTTIKKDGGVTENKQLANESNNSPSSVITKSLFSSFKERERQTFTPPRSKPAQKLGISKVYNVNSKHTSKGNNLKQTKLVAVPDVEKTDLSKTVNYKNDAENSALDSIFDSTIFKCNSSLENMDIDVEDSFSIAKTSIDDKTSAISTPKKTQTTKNDDFEQMSPSKENKKLKAKSDVKSKKLKIDDSESMNSNLGLSVFNPQASSTQIFSQKSQNVTGAKTRRHSHSDSDTDYSFQDDHHSRKQLSPGAKKTPLKKTSPKEKKTYKNLLRKSPCKQKLNKGCVELKQSDFPENALDDETFFSPGEYQNNAGVKDPKPSTSGETVTAPKSKRVLMSNFDEIPEKRNRNPDYAYVEETVRKKCDRAKLNGWSCWDCKKYYQNLELPEKELKECLKKCSRHRAKYDPEYHTPPDFWNPAFTDTFAPTPCEKKNAK